MTLQEYADTTAGMRTEIARLRAEVERLKLALVRSTDDFVKPTVEKLERERDEALAQVAVLWQYARHQSECGDIGQNSCTCGLWSAEANLPVEARALLDRLAMLEDGSMTNQRLVWLEDHLQRAEAGVEALARLVWRRDHLSQQSGVGSEEEWQAARDFLAVWEKEQA